MIDRVSRDKLALVIRRFATGKITNFEFENAMFKINQNHRDSAICQDNAIECIVDYMWRFYDDLREYKAINRDKFNKDVKKHIAKIILFLQSDFEYVYPKSSSLTGFLNILSFGIYGYFINKKFEKAGDMDYYPFRHRDDFDTSLKFVKFLNPS